MKFHDTNKRTRFAIYTRYSSDMQNEMSLEAQEKCCRQAIAERNGVIVDVYCDGAKSGWSLEREGFNHLRKDAERGRFDAVMFWKFDRLARNHDHAVMIKVLLRTEYNLKLYCVEGFSEDDDNSPYTAMMEQMLAVFSAFYSKNLSTETKRGKKQRALKGYFNGSHAPFGYDLVTATQHWDERDPGLYVNPDESQIIQVLFQLYATGEHSDASLARWINTLEYVQESRKGRKMFGKDTIRDILRNRIYTGRVSYTETVYRGSLGQGRVARRNREQWFEGKHERIIDDELFDYAMQVRFDARRLNQSVGLVRTYVLQDRVYCARCTASKPEDVVDANFGKMRPNWYAARDIGYYRCHAHNRGYRKCEQSSIPIHIVDDYVIYALFQLEIPVGFQERVERAVQQQVDNAEALRKMEELNQVAKRVNFSWEQGFLDVEEYMEKRREIEAELAALRPVQYDDLMEAADLIRNFRTYWEKCDDLEEPMKARRQLLAKIIDRVFVYDDSVIAISLHGDYGIVLDTTLSVPSEILTGLKIKMDTSTLENTCVQDGIDGI